MSYSVGLVDTNGEWPNNKNAYRLDDVIGVGSVAIIHQAYCKTRQEICAIKRIPLERGNSRIDELKEIQILINLKHKNVFKYFTLFLVDEELWVISKLFEEGSMLDLINYKSQRKNCIHGVLDEITIATVLKKVLKALVYLHYNGLIHRDIKAENIMISADGNIQIAGCGLSAWLAMGADYLQNDAMQSIMENARCYDSTADIWSIGILAIELATGISPYHKLHAMNCPMLAIQNESSEIKDSYFSSYQYRDYEELRDVIDVCLEKDSTERPTAAELLKYPLFKKAKTRRFLVKKLSPYSPYMSLRIQKAKGAKRLLESRGWRCRGEPKDWIWSFDNKEQLVDLQTNESEEQENIGSKFVKVPIKDRLIRMPYCMYACKRFI